MLKYDHILTFLDISNCTTWKVMGKEGSKYPIKPYEYYLESGSKRIDNKYVKKLPLYVDKGINYTHAQ